MPAVILNKLIITAEIHGHGFSAVRTAWNKLAWDSHIVLPFEHFTDHRFVIKCFLTARLTAQLRAMEESGLVHREVYAEVPPRVEYSLTELGRSLKPILDSMWAWGEGYKAMMES